MEITQKQANFIVAICRTLRILNPKIETKKEAQQWISDHIDEYNEVKNGREFDEREDEFAMYGGCDDLQGGSV